MGCFATTAAEGSVDRAIFIAAKFHKELPLKRGIAGDFEAFDCERGW
jgi:hypothetical protein